MPHPRPRPNGLRAHDRTAALHKGSRQATHGRARSAQGEAGSEGRRRVQVPRARAVDARRPPRAVARAQAPPDGGVPEPAPAEDRLDGPRGAPWFSRLTPEADL